MVGSSVSGSVRAVVFDLDGTLIDSDAPLLEAFVSLGVPASTVTYGHAVAEECERLGLALDDYVAAYDTTAAQPFAEVDEVLGSLDRWAVCSNKHPASGEVELERLGWEPEVALFADAFGWRHKHLGPVLERLGLGPHEVVMVGDSDGDLRCAEEVGCHFLWAGWNDRTARMRPSGEVLARPSELLRRLGLG